MDMPHLPNEPHGLRGELYITTGFYWQVNMKG